MKTKTINHIKTIIKQNKQSFQKIIKTINKTKPKPI